MSLRTKFLRNILPPSVIGILTTAVIAITFLLSFYLNIINDTKSQILDQEYTSVKSISDSLSLSLQEYFRLKLSYLEECINYSETFGDLSDFTTPASDNITILNAYDLVAGFTNLSTYPEYDPIFQYCTSVSMWYLNPQVTNISSLPPDSLKRLLFAQQLELNFKAIFDAVRGLTNLYMVFFDDGLQFLYPAANRGRYLNYNTNNKCPYTTDQGGLNYYDLRCTSQMQFGLEFLATAPLNTTLFISKTFILLEFQSIGITLCGVHFKNSTRYNYSEIPLANRSVEYAICGEFLLFDIQSVFDVASTTQQGYSYVLDRYDNVIFHPAFLKFNSSTKEVMSITEYEFGVDDTLNNSLAVEYNKTVLPLIDSTFQQNSDISSFQKQTIKLAYDTQNGEQIGTLSPIFFPLPNSNVTYHGANLIFMEPSEAVMQPFINIRYSIYQMITVQSIGVCVVIILLSWIGFRIINYIVNSIITPLNDLNEVVMKMVDDDLDTDVTRNYTPNSEEITQLYQSFSKLKFVMKYANAEFFSGNDAQALINYSNALKLYQEINNKDGIGMAYNNIGNIHLKNKRYEEAIDFYRKAVDMIESDLNAFYKDNSFFRDEIKFKEKYCQQNSKKPIYIRSRRNYKSHKLAENQNTDDSTLNKMNELYSNRLFQLGLTLYTQNFSNNHEENLDEIIQIFEKVIQIDSFLQNNPARTIQALIFISNCYLEQGNHLATLKYLNEAESSVFLYETAQRMLELDPEMLKKLKETDEDKEMSSDLDFFNNNSSQFTIKSDILKQLWMYHSAVFCKKMGKLKQACIIYTKALETGKIYDPLIRKKCLEDLSFILASQGLLSKAPNITTILSRFDSFKGKEIVFLLDVSESMGEGARLRYAIRNFVKIFDKYVRVDDKVAFLRFNYMCEVVFNLTPKKNNTIQLRRQIESTSQTSGGTAFYDAINMAISEFGSLRKDLNDDSSKLNSHWIVSLTDGEDNLSRISADVVKKKLRQKGINLIIIGLGLGVETVGSLSELCKATKDGVFIETPNNDDLDIAFESISEIIYGTNFIVETFSFS